MAIPRIIHQIWSDKNKPLPYMFQQLAETWKNCHPHWEYCFWDDNKMSTFIHEYYPEYVERYNSLPFDIQRWDTIRYLILYEIGGVYVDLDYECLENIEPLLCGTCCFPKEPIEHNINSKYQGLCCSNSLIAVEPKHPFINSAIKQILEKEYQASYKDKFKQVLSTTGPWMLTDLYLSTKDKSGIHLIDAKYLSPYTGDEVQRLADGEKSEELEKKLQSAYAIHYFTGTWLIE